MSRELGIGLAAVVALRALVIIGAIVFGAWTGSDDVFAARPEIFPVLLAIAAGQIAVTLAMARALKKKLTDFGWTTDELGLRILQGLGGFVFITVGMALFFGLVDVTPKDMLETTLGFSPAQRAMIVIIGLLAAFAEETVFRGHLQPLATEKWGPIAGPLAVAILFDVYHLAFAPIALAVKMWIATTLWIMRARTGTLVAGAIAHGLVWVVWGAL